MGVKLDDQQWFADMKPESLAYTMSLHSTIGRTCFWQSMRDLEDGKPCLCHPHAATCPPPPPGYIDILWGSGPCQFVSQQRRNSTLPEHHKGFDALFGRIGSILSNVAKLLPKLFITENVAGFGHKQKKGIFKDITPLYFFVGKMFEIMHEGRRHFAAHLPLACDPGMWLRAKRPRIARKNRQQNECSRW